MLPSLFTENLLDDFFRFPMTRVFQADHYSHNLMDTDVKDTDGAYVIAVNLPGFKKEDVQCELKNGYLTIDATTNSNSDMQDENSRYIRRERYHGACRRSFYLGSHTKKSDIKAKFEDGVLTLIVALLNAAGIHTLGDIDDKSDEQLLKIAGITENNIAAVSALRNQGGNRMTFFSTKCVNCTENSKRVISKWISRDEKGKFVAFSYECRNYGCSIQYGRNKKQNRFANQNEKEM